MVMSVVRVAVMIRKNGSICMLCGGIVRAVVLVLIVKSDLPISSMPSDYALPVSISNLKLHSKTEQLGLTISPQDSLRAAENQVSQYAVELQQAQVSLSNQFQKMVAQGPHHPDKFLSLAPGVFEPPTLPHQEMLRFLSTLCLPVSECPSTKAPFPPSHSSPGLLPTPQCSQSTGLLAQAIPVSQGSRFSSSFLNSSTGIRTQASLPGGSAFPGFGAGPAVLADTGAVPRRKAEAAGVQEGKCYLTDSG